MRPLSDGLLGQTCQGDRVGECERPPYPTCACGARHESPDTHSHVLTCPCAPFGVSIADKYERAVRVMIPANKLVGYVLQQRCIQVLACRGISTSAEVAEELGLTEKGASFTVSSTMLKLERGKIVRRKYSGYSATRWLLAKEKST